MKRAFFFIGVFLFATTSFASIPRVSALDHPSPIAAPSQKTRIRVSDVLAPFERQVESELTRALRQAYGDASTTNASGLGRFLSVDPAMDLKKILPTPQRWNRYSYVSNNPINKIDPDGREENFYMEQLFREQQMVAEGKMTEEQYMTRRQGEGVGTLIGVAAVGAVLGGPPAWRAASAFAMRQYATLMGGGGSVVLGETMRRVRSAADALNARTFETTSRNFSQTMTQNMQWLQRQMASGAKIYDVGLNVARRDGGSAFYKAEVQALQNAGWTRQFVRLMEIDGKTYRVYQWVAPAK